MFPEVQEKWGVLPSKGGGVDSYPTPENVFVFFLRSLVKLEINTVTSFLNFCQWRLFTANRSCYLELRGVCGMSWTSIVFQSVLRFHSQYWNLLRTGLKCFMTRADVLSCCPKAPVGSMCRPACVRNQQTPLIPTRPPVSWAGTGRAWAGGWRLLWALGPCCRAGSSGTCLPH